MIKLISQIIVIALIVIVAYLYSKENVDVTGYLLILSVVACIITALVYDTETNVFINSFPMTSIIYLVFIDIFINLLIKNRIFEYFSLKIIRYTKSNMRQFFYLICITSSLISGIMEDVSAAIILFPIVFRATKIIKIEPKPFIYGTTASIIIGNLLTPIAAPVNILFSESFDLTMGWFFKYLLPLYFVSLGVTLFFIDKKYIREIDPPDPVRIKMLIEIMDPRLLIRNKRKLYRFVGYLSFIVAGLVINYYPFVFVALSVSIITMIEERKFTDLFNKANWNIPLVFIGFFLLITCIEINGTIEMFQSGLLYLIGDNPLIAIIIVYFFAGLITSYIARTLSFVIFLSVLQGFFVDVFTDPSVQLILLITFVISLHLGGNLLPQSSTFILKMLEQARERNLSEIQYNNIKKILGKFTTLAAALGLAYIFILAAIMGVV